MKTTSHINNILIVGGTHGNELSGVESVTQWLSQENLKLKDYVPSAQVNLHLANTAAIASRRRFVEDDLNRQFTLNNLNTSLSHTASLEAQVARQFNQTYGPKTDAANSKVSVTDFIIDIHNTTSNMGATLIILVNDHFHQQLARFVKTHMPESIILVEDAKAYADNGYLCTVGKRGVMIEVGPQAHGTLRASLYQQTLKMTELILRYIENVNLQQHQSLPPVDAYRLLTEVAYPVNAKGKKAAMIHPSLDGKDFVALYPEQACFVDFAGNTIGWSGSITYPHFIGEAAYDHLNLAFATSDKCLF